MTAYTLHSQWRLRATGKIAYAMVLRSSATSDVVRFHFVGELDERRASARSFLSRFERISTASKTLKVGDRVLVRGHHDEGERTIIKLYDDIPGGVKLDKAVGLFHSWNEDSLDVLG